MAGPAKGDWTRIRIAQMRDAGKSFGNFAEPGPNGKLVPKMTFAYGRELLRYWLAAGVEAKERKFGSFSVSPAVERFDTAERLFREGMQVFADAASSGGLALSHPEVVHFFDVVGKFANALSALDVSPSMSDLWWRSVGEAVDDIKGALKVGGSWVLVAGLVALVVLGGKNRRG